MDLSPQQQAFIDDFASLWDQFGANNTQGRVLALLYIADDIELSANDIASALGISRGSVSQNTRQLAMFRIIQRVTRPGDRRDYFRLAASPFGEAAKMERALLGTFVNLFQRGLDLHNTSPPERQRALKNSIAFMKDYDAALGDFLENWKPPDDMENS